MREKPANKFGKYQCPCCGYYTLEEIHHHHEICGVCFWQDEYYTDANTPDGGPNKESLNEARANFKKVGACNEACADAVRPPLPKKCPTPRHKLLLPLKSLTLAQNYLHEKIGFCIDMRFGYCSIV